VPGRLGESGVAARLAIGYTQYLQFIPKVIPPTPSEVSGRPTSEVHLVRAETRP
jgi:hypothetical protein